RAILHSYPTRRSSDLASLEDFGEVHEDPQQIDPTGTTDESRTDVTVSFERGLSGQDRPLRELELNPDLDGGRDDDEPQQDETGLGSECGCRNEFSGADDGRSDDEPGAQVLEFARECCGWLEHILGIAMVWIDVC